MKAKKSISLTLMAVSISLSTAALGENLQFMHPLKGLISNADQNTEGAGSGDGLNLYSDPNTGDPIPSVSISTTSFNFEGASNNYGHISFSLAESTSTAPGNTIRSNENGQYPVSKVPTGAFSASMPPHWDEWPDTDTWEYTTMLFIDVDIVDVSSVPEGASSLVFKFESLGPSGNVVDDMIVMVDFSVVNGNLTTNNPADMSLSDGVSGFRVVPLGFSSTGGESSGKGELLGGGLRGGEGGYGGTELIDGMPSNLTLGISRADLMMY
jgi:hypothetical protein